MVLSDSRLGSICFEKISTLIHSDITVYTWICAVFFLWRITSYDVLSYSAGALTDRQGTTVKCRRDMSRGFPGVSSRDGKESKILDSCSGRVLWWYRFDSVRALRRWNWKHVSVMVICYITSCAGGRHNMPPPQQADLWPFAAVSHGQHVPTPPAAAAWRANTAASKAAWWPWPLTFWPWKWYSSHMWRGLPLCQF